MNIAVIAHANHPIRQPFVGGLEAHTHQMIGKLSKLGHSVTVFAKSSTQTDAQLVSIFSGNAYAGKHPLLPHGYRRAMRVIARGDYDLIINNSLNSTPLELHSGDMPPMLTIFHTPPFWQLSTVLQQQLSMPNRAYIAVSEFTANQWRPYLDQPVHVVPNGLNLGFWKFNTQKPNQTTAAWVGRITPEKGPHVAIEACIKAGIPLRLGGPIYDRRYFNKSIKPLLKQPLIEYIGHLNHVAVNNLFMEATVALVTPLWDEPFGLVEIEAWASGTPVAALPNGALPSLVRPDVGCLAASDSADDLVVAMQNAVSFSRAACRRYANDSFSMSAMVESYLALAPEVVNDENLDLLWQPAQ